MIERETYTRTLPTDRKSVSYTGRGSVFQMRMFLPWREMMVWKEALVRTTLFHFQRRGRNEKIVVWDASAVVEL